MTEVLHFLAHGANPIRGLSFGPTDSKFASCSDDSTVSVVTREGIEGGDIYAATPGFLADERTGGLNVYW